MEISLGVAANGMSPVQIAWRDLVDWSDLTGNALEPWEARALVTLGVVRMNIQSEKLTTESKTPHSPHRVK